VVLRLRLSVPKFAHRGAGEGKQLRIIEGVEKKSSSIKGKMMVLPQQTTSMSEDDYLALEHNSEHRHEFWDGDVYAMTGASENHIDLTGTLYLPSLNLTLTLSDIYEQINFAQ
jgi:hypothetical protein